MFSTRSTLFWSGVHLRIYKWMGKILSLGMASMEHLLKLSAAVHFFAAATLTIVKLYPQKKREGKTRPKSLFLFPCLCTLYSPVLYVMKKNPYPEPEFVNVPRVPSINSPRLQKAGGIDS
jgi:hypothetical protein